MAYCSHELKLKHSDDLWCYLVVVAAQLQSGGVFSLILREEQLESDFRF